MMGKDTQKILRITPILSSLLITVACATSESSSVQPESSLKIIVGQTTQEEVLSLLGAPRFKRIIVNREGKQEAWVYEASQIENDLLLPEIGKSIMTGGLDQPIERKNRGVSIRFTRERRVEALTEVHWSENGLGLFFTP